MIYTLLILVSGLLLISIIAFDRDLTAPSFLLISGFWAASFCACIYANKWSFYDYKLVCVIILGLLGFFTFSFITYIIDKKGRRPNKRVLIGINISKTKYLVYLSFQIILYSLTIIVLVRNMGSFSLAGLATMINSYYEMSRTGKVVYSSRMVDIGQIINFSGTYYVIYVACNNIVIRHKNPLLLYLNILVGCLGSLLTGTKTAFYMYLIGAFVMYTILHQKKCGWKQNIRFGRVVKTVFVLFILLLIFNVIDFIQGRTLSNISAVDKLATYLGAPIKNLEFFINEEYPDSPVFGQQTFKSIYSSIYEITKDSRLVSTYNFFKYRWVNGHPLGNVSTMFMPILYDFGYVGVFIVMGVVGAFSQKVYDIVKFGNTIYDTDLYTIFYGFIAFSIAFSFFSNKYFESVFAKAGLYFVIGLFLFDCFFISFNSGKILTRKKRMRLIRKRIIKDDVERSSQTHF